MCGKGVEGVHYPLCGIGLGIVVNIFSAGGEMWKYQLPMIKQSRQDATSLQGSREIHLGLPWKIIE